MTGLQGCTIVIALLCALQSAAGLADDAADRRVLRELYDATGGEITWYPAVHHMCTVVHLTPGSQSLPRNISIATLQVELVCLACLGLCVCVVLHLVGCDVRDESVHGHCTRRRPHTGALCGRITVWLSAEFARRSICADLAHHFESSESSGHHAIEPRQAIVLVCLEVWRPICLCFVSAINIGMLSVAAPLCATRICRARLTNNRMSGAVPFAALASLARLSTLDVSGNQFSGNLSSPLFSPALWPQLSTLRLGRNRFGDSNALITVSLFSNLVQLVVGYARSHSHANGEALKLDPM